LRRPPYTFQNAFSLQAQSAEAQVRCFQAISTRSLHSGELPGGGLAKPVQITGSHVQVLKSSRMVGPGPCQ
jgi:hypothetical protein